MSYKFKESFPVINTATGESDTISEYVETITQEQRNGGVIQINNFLFLNQSEQRVVPLGAERLLFRMLDEPFHQYRLSIQQFIC